LRSKRDLGIVPDGRIDILIRNGFVVLKGIKEMETSVNSIKELEAIVDSLMRVVPDIFILVEAVERAYEGVTSGGAGTVL
jgi:hypothetical protein